MSYSLLSSAPRRILVAAFVAIAALFGAVLVPTAAHALDYSLTIKVKNPEGAGIPGYYVYLKASGGDLDEGATDESGNVVFTVSPGQYTFYVEATDSEYLEQWWNGKTSWDAADYFTVSGATTKTMTLQYGATLRGTVTDSDEQPVAGAEVLAYTATGLWREKATTTDEDGVYVLRGLPTGNYKLQVRAEGFVPAWWGPKQTLGSAALVPVTAGEIVDEKDVSLVRGASVAGAATFAGGTAAGGAQVRVLDKYGADTDWILGETEEDGTFDVTGLTAGTYSIRVRYEDAHSQWQGASSQFTIAADGRKTGLNVVLEQIWAETAERGSANLVATFEGDEVPVLASFFDLDGMQAASCYEGCSSVSLPAGVYKVKADATSGSTATTWAGGNSFATATSFTVTAGETTDVTVELAAGAAISGRVTDGAGDGPDSVGVSAHRIGAEVDREIRFGTIDSEGYFTIDGLANGQWKVFAQSYGTLASEWWQNSATMGGATPITIADGESVSGIAMQLGAGATISGRVDYAGTNAPAAFGSVELRAGDEVFGMGLNGNGEYVIEGIPAGEYTLSATHCPVVDCANAWYGNTSHAASAETITLTLGETLGNVDIELPSVPAASGTILDPAGDPIAGAFVYAFQSNGSGYDEVGGAMTDGLGNYTLPGLSFGEYKLAFTDYSTGNSFDGTGGLDFVDEFWENKSSLASGDGIILSPTSTRTATNVTLQSTGEPELGTITAPTPTISGTPAVGQTLTAVATGWTPSDVTLGYQWLRDGEVIEGATASTYLVKADDAGHNLRVKVSGSKDGFSPLVKSSADVLVALELTTAIPSISGTPTVGKTLTAAPGTWGPAPVTLKYSWARNGVTISGATSSTYVTTTSDLDKSVTVTVTGSKTGYTTASQTSLGVTIGRLLTAGTPTISGTPTVGYVLTAASGTWTSGTVIDYQWLRDGAPIPGATESAWLLDSDDVGHTITVAATGSKPGYTSVTKTSAGKLIGDALAATPTPSISGTPTVGKTLTMTTGTWDADSTLSYRWKRNGASISGATGTSYKLTSSDAGKTITVTVTGTKTGYTPVSVTSAGVKVGKAFLTSPTPKISGTPTVGQKLTGSKGIWLPLLVTLKSQWLRNGEPISGATSSSYVLTAADQGQTISYRVTASKSGYTTVVKESTGKLIGWALTATPTPTVSGTPTVGETLTASAGTWSPDPVTLAYQWKRDGKAIADAVGASYTLVTGDAGKSITVSVTGSQAGFTSVTKTSSSKKIGKAFTSAPVPVITGTPALGAKLTANVGTWAPATVTLTYQWYRDGTAISGATSKTRTISASDLGKTLTFKVTATKTGYTKVSKTSDPVVIPAPTV